MDVLRPRRTPTLSTAAVAASMDAHRVRVKAPGITHHLNCPVGVAMASIMMIIVIIMALIRVYIE
jgi:hypothetical protein